MGAYLSAPVTEKESFEGSDGGLVFGGSAMQGWRRTMEDAHTAVVRVADSDIALFGVYDGHGGAEVARFCSKHMPEELTRLAEFRAPSGPHVADGLVKLFHRMDEMLRHDDFQRELEGYRGRRSDEEEESGGEEEGGSGPGGEGNAMSPNEAIDVLKKLIAWRRVMNEGNGAGSGGGGSGGSGGDAEGAGAAGGAGGQEAEIFLDEDMQEDNLPEHSIQAGCTAVVALLVNKKHLYVANAGDSRAVLCRAGKAVALSEDHKPAQDRERNRIVAAGGFLSDIGGVCRVNGNLNLSRAIGDLKYKANDALPASDQIITAQPDVQYMELGEDDQFFVLACDGVWDVMENQECVDFVLERLAKGMAPREVCCELLDACLANNPKDAKGIGCDNMTAQVVMLPAGTAQFGTPQPLSGSGEAGEASAPEVAAP